MGLQHDNPNALPQDAPRTQCLTADESRAVIARWQQERVEQTGLTDRPALPDVAEGLDIPVEEVQRLLAEVRAQRLEEERALVQEQARMRLADEERGLAEIRRQRAQLQQRQVHPKGRTRPRGRWLEVKLGVWEDVNQQAKPLSLCAKVGVIIICLILSTVITILGFLWWTVSFMPHN